MQICAHVKQAITGCDEHAVISIRSIQDRFEKRVDRITSDPTHPRHKLFHPPPLWQVLQSPAHKNTPTTHP